MGKYLITMDWTHACEGPIIIIILIAVRPPMSIFCYGIFILLFASHLCPGVTKRNGAVKHRFFIRRIGINAEITCSLKLKTVARFGVFYGWFNQTVFNHFQRVRVEMIKKGRAIFLISGGRVVEQPVV